MGEIQGFLGFALRAALEMTLISENGKSRMTAGRALKQ